MLGDPNCEICKGTGVVPTLDIWSMAKTAADSPVGLGTYQDAKSLPLIEGTPCSACREEEYREVLDILYARNGNPWRQE